MARRHIPGLWSSISETTMRPYLAAIAIMLPAALAAQDPTGQALPTGQRLTPSAAPGAQFEPLVAGIGPDPTYVVDGAAAIAPRP
ncbi:hypothetical protein LXJ59_26070, partial [Escherichia coli]|nr:hypothetical protein [Escherichia coli]